mmetsp:Transcript_27740/g.66839  ORF Transcript_27740/g.66839 Transcript_27740/m.66839 type:complete len:87 (-) Transcript_27740:125-385(-)
MPNTGIAIPYIDRGVSIRSFESFHNSGDNKENDATEFKKRLARTMEDFPLAAIMGRVVSKNLEDEDDRTLGEDRHHEVQANRGERR